MGLADVAVYAITVLFFGLVLVVLPIFVLVDVLRRGWPRARQRPVLRIGLVVLALLVFGFVLLVTWGPLLAVRRAQRDSKHKSVCLWHARQLTQAALSYAEDHDGRLPEASTWCDELLPYVESAEVFRCPFNPRLKSGYAYNTALSGVEAASVEEETSLVLIFESDAGWNAFGGQQLLPAEPRYGGGDNYGFADGSVKWLPRKKLPDGTWAKAPDADWLIWEPVLKESEHEP